MTLIDNHIAISRRFIQHAEEELEKGDLLQASEKSWGAVAHRLEAIAGRRRWSHSSHKDYYHKDYYRIIANLSEETNRPEEFLALFDVADSLHANFYNDFKPEELVRTGLVNVKKLLDILDDIETAAP